MLFHHQRSLPRTLHYHLMTDLARFGVKPSQDAIEADDEIDAAERRVQLLQCALGGAENVARPRHGEN